MRIKLTVLCLLFCLQFFGQREMYYKQVIPTQKQDEDLIARFDTATFRFMEGYVKDTSTKKPFEQVYTTSRFWTTETLQGQYYWPRRKVLTTNHELFGHWNLTFDTLNIHALFNLFFHDTTTSTTNTNSVNIPRNPGFQILSTPTEYPSIALPLIKYKDILSKADYDKILAIVQRYINQKYFMERVDSFYYSTISFPIDTVILPQVDFKEMPYTIRNYQHWDRTHNHFAYYDRALRNPIFNGKEDSIIIYPITLQVSGPSYFSIRPTKKDSSNLRAFWDSAYVATLIDTTIMARAQPLCLTVTYKWHYAYTNKGLYDRIPAIVLVREPHAVGIQYENGGQVFYSYPSFKTIVEPNAKSFVPVEQCFEAVLYKNLDINPRRTQRWIIEK